MEGQRYLSAEIFEWDYGSASASSVDEINYFYRAHDIWRHAKDRLKSATSDFDRADCIGSLRRAINYRLKALVTVYRLDMLPVAPVKAPLQRFREYGLVRPSLINDIMNIRNQIEHHDAPAPDRQACMHSVDIVWYFLKSTDELIRMSIDALEYIGDDGDDSVVNFEIAPPNGWKAVVRATIREELLQVNPVEGSLYLENVVVTDIGKKPGYLSLRADAVLTSERLSRLAKDYFGAAGYWCEDQE